MNEEAVEKRNINNGLCVNKTMIGDSGVEDSRE
jgi:hypothetical protein